MLDLRKKKRKNAEKDPKYQKLHLYSEAAHNQERSVIIQSNNSFLSGYKGKLWS